MLICTCQVHVWIHISQKGKEMIHIFYTFVVFWGCHSLNNWRKATLPTQALVKIPCSWKRTLGEKYTRFDQKVSSHVLWKIKTFIQEDKRYKKHCTQKNDTSVSFKVGTFRPHTVPQITMSCPVVFFWISSMVWNLFLFKDDFSFGKSWKSQGAKCGL